MNRIDVMRKYNLSVNDVLNLRAYYGGKVYVEEVHADEDGVVTEGVKQWSDGGMGRCSVQFTTVAETIDFNRTQALFITLSDEAFNAILGTRLRNNGLSDRS